MIEPLEAKIYAINFLEESEASPSVGLTTLLLDEKKLNGDATDEATAIEREREGERERESERGRQSHCENGGEGEREKRGERERAEKGA